MDGAKEMRRARKLSPSEFLVLLEPLPAGSQIRVCSGRLIVSRFDGRVPWFDPDGERTGEVSLTSRAVAG